MAVMYEVSESWGWSLRRLIASMNSRHVLLVVGGEYNSSLDVLSSFFLACHIALAPTENWHHIQYDLVIVGRFGITCSDSIPNAVI